MVADSYLVFPALKCPFVFNIHSNAQVIFFNRHSDHIVYLYLVSLTCELPEGKLLSHSAPVTVYATYQHMDIYLVNATK